MTNIFEKFINKPLSSRAELENLCEKLDIKANVDWAENWNGATAILNIGDNEGTHWVAISCLKDKDAGYAPSGSTTSDRKIYFDSFGLPPDSDIPNWSELEWNPFQIQPIDQGFCGQYCVCFLWYMQHNQEDEFWKLWSML